MIITPIMGHSLGLLPANMGTNVKRLLLTSTALLLLVPSARAQTAVGVGIANSRSDSAALASSRSTAIGGGQGIGTGGSATATIINPTQPSATVSTQNLVTSGTSTVKNVPSVFSPGLAAAGLETCLGSVSGGGSFVGTGFSFGSTIPDPGCAARLDARTLWSMGLKKAAIARLCLGGEIRAAMPEVCAQYLPAQPTAGYYLSADSTSGLRSGQIWLVEGKTGADRLCNDYDATKQRCRVWDGEVVHRHARKQPQVAAVTPPKAAPQEDQTK